MNKRTREIAGSLAIAAIAAIVGTAAHRATHAAETGTMELGNFSVSLAVRDLAASRAFYEKLDFREVGGRFDQNWIVLQNGSARIGLFQGMLDQNTLTFNPGWAKDRETAKRFEDVRVLQRTLKARGVRIVTEADETTKGPAYFRVTDPDGNAILFDQHVPSPDR